MKKVLIIYASMSGNTEEVAEILAEELRGLGVHTDEYYVCMTGFGKPPKISDYDAVIVGTYTWDFGYVPDELDEFLTNNEINGDCYVFGTGETQFGDELYCKAVDDLHKQLSAAGSPLKIEGSPRGRQERRVKRWVRGLFEGRAI